MTMKYVSYFTIIVVVVTIIIRRSFHILLNVHDISQDTLGAAPATEIKLEDHCPYKYGHIQIF